MTLTSLRRAARAGECVIDPASGEQGKLHLRRLPGLRDECPQPVESVKVVHARRSFRLTDQRHPPPLVGPDEVTSWAIRVVGSCSVVAPTSDTGGRPSSMSSRASRQMASKCGPNT